MRVCHTFRLLVQMSNCSVRMRIANAISALFALLIIAGVHGANADTVAETSRFAVNAKKIPTGASTKFFVPIWTKGDATFTAHHELLHAIGFTVTYDKFKGHVDSSRNFLESDPASGTILAKLTPANQGTHIDPNAGTVNEYDQSKSVMRPDRVSGPRMGPQEKSVQNAALDWSSKNINITVKYVGTWNATQKSYIESAVTSAKTLFGSNGTGHEFTWTVEVANSLLPTEVQNLSSLRISDLAAQLVSGTADQRVQATAEVLRRGVSAVPELLAAGAQPMSGLSPRRLDVLYSILSAHRDGRYRTNSFGLHVEPGTTRQEIISMGERYGFVLPDEQSIEIANAPCCYVMIREGGELWEAIARVLSTEAKVNTVNLNYIEP
jgi:hypothetical protein